MAKGMAKKVLFLGGGPCTLIGLRRLREKLGPEEVEATIITNSEWHYFPPLFADLALGEVEVDEIRGPVKTIAERYHANLVLDEVTKVDPANRRVTTKGGKTFNYDYLFICLGVRNAPEVIPGLAEHGYHNYSLEGALRMREALAKFKGGDIVVLVPDFPHRCPGYPFEIAAKLAYFAERKGKPYKVHLVHLLNMNKIIEVFNEIPMTVHRIHSQFKNIEYHVGKKTVEVKDDKIIFEDGEMKYDLLIYAPPTRVPKAVEGVDDLLCKNDPERVMAAVFPSFRNPKYDDVFVPTDASLPCVGLPPAGVVVHEAAVAAADQLIADITGVRATIRFPRQVPLVADFGPTGLLISFEIYDNGDGTATAKKYVAFTSPLIKSMKLSFYLGWIWSLK
ncbi:hypothetical protein IPA_00435 [Ignicoccus pacificus DSM 13166]|uniref:FAD/NAD(P)-binding domain-containing protein n=1 Tax=Ignicoccus pacificus DSM 13166 TaxID=940294 RepID=A0A977KCA1_9CREN|nr:hypothetical protein IPA_00435 [Ignicoccus pacificus DSM 13166]